MTRSAHTSEIHQPTLSAMWGNGQCKNRKFYAKMTYFKCLLSDQTIAVPVTTPTILHNSTLLTQCKSMEY